MSIEIEEITNKFEELSLTEIDDIKDYLISHNIPLFRLDKEKGIVEFSTEQLSLILDNPKYANLKLYIPKNFKVFVKEFKAIKENEKSNLLNSNYVFKTPKECEEELDKRIKEIGKMTYEDKISIIETYNRELKEVKVDERTKINRNTAQQIVNAGNDVGLIAKVTMFESMKKIKDNEISQDQAKIENQEITETTSALVTTIVNMLSYNTETQKVFTELRNYSDGGVMAHSNRVFISYVNFLTFYNNLIKRRHLVHNIRTVYEKVYEKYYDKIIETVGGKYKIYDNLKTVEDCIDQGIKSVEEQEMYSYSVGALLHDVGKVKDLDYFEGADGRDYERIKKHLFNSYKLVSQTSEYPLEVILTVALHHEYYGLGYGPYEKLHNMKVEKYQGFQIQRIMSYNAKAIDDCD
ncbi:HD domain-containing protein, partial [Brachyspira catarrhinii]